MSTLGKTKKDSSWGILEVCDIGIDKIKDTVLKFDQEWSLDTSRQDNNVTHKNTEMYPLRFMDYGWNRSIKPEFSDVYSFNNIEADNQLKEIYNKLEELYDSKVVRSEVVRMGANINIRRHVDGGEMLFITRRCHIPITTNELVFFTVYNDTVNMKEGKVYEINNSMPHSVQNASDQARVHIIVDMLSNEYFD